MTATPARTVWLPALIVAATILNGLLAGGNVDRALVAMPAWRRAGPVAWAVFSRYADLGNGLFIYPAMAIGGTLLSVIGAAIFLARGASPSRAVFPIVLAAALMLVSLPLSFKAAPFMLSLRHLQNGQVAAIASAFAGFEFWGGLQGLMHVVAFCANLWSLAAIGAGQSDS